MNCEVCLEPSIKRAINLGSHPLCDDLTPIGKKTEVDVFSQEITLCSKCLTAHQVYPVKKELLFRETYRYRAALTQDVLTGMDNLVSTVADLFNIDEKSKILDIGCNDGSLLKIFKKRFNCQVIGVDPTNAILEAKDQLTHAFEGFFNSEVSNQILEEFGAMNIITFTNVFAHIENLPELLSNLNKLINDETLLVIENHYLGSILKTSQFDTFYHEHPRTYSATSFVYIAKTLNMEVKKIEFPARYGGNIRVILSRSNAIKAENQLKKILDKESMFYKQFYELEHFYLNWQQETRNCIVNLAQEGEIFGKSLPGRAVMLISSLNINASFMPAVYEQPSSPKNGHYVPGTKIEIRSDEELFANNPKKLIVWSWHIIDEIIDYLSQNDFHGEIWVPMPTFRLYKVL
jgi:SAM-dependent methyltransferase